MWCYYYKQNFFVPNLFSYKLQLVKHFIHGLIFWLQRTLLLLSGLPEEKHDNSFFFSVSQNRNIKNFRWKFGNKPPTSLLPVSGNLFLRQASSELLESPSIPTSHISLVECLDFSLSIWKCSPSSRLKKQKWSYQRHWHYHHLCHSALTLSLLLH